MKMSTRIAAAIIALPLMLTSASALAYPDKHQGCNGKMKPKQLLRGIELTDAQKAQMDKLYQQNRAQKIDNKNLKANQKSEHHQKIQTLLLSENFNEAEVRALAQEMSSQQVENRVAKAKKQHDMFKLLTPAQKEQVKQNMQKMQNCNQKRMKNHH